MRQAVYRQGNAVFVHTAYRVARACAAPLFDDGDAGVVTRQVADIEYLFLAEGVGGFDQFAQTGYFVIAAGFLFFGFYLYGIQLFFLCLSGLHIFCINGQRSH